LPCHIDVGAKTADGWLGMHSHLLLNRGVPQISHGDRPVKARQG
jgi:hypothetical protein